MADNDKLRAIAIKVLEKSRIPKEDDQYGFAIITILMIISIILTCVRIIQECNKSKLAELATPDQKYAMYGSEIRSFSAKRGWFTKMRIKKILRKEMSREDYIKYSFSIMNALLDTGETLNTDEIQTVVEAAYV